MRYAMLLMCVCLGRPYAIKSVVPRFSSNQFKQHFRIVPTTFEKLVQYLVEVKRLENRRADGHPEIHIDKQLMVTIWFLANLESLRSIACRFNISKSTCWETLKKTSNRLLKVNEYYGLIRWPNENEAVQTMNYYERQSNFPGIIGCVDGSHVEIVAPKNFPNSYLNRKKYHSVLLQGICNHKKLFIDVYAGEPGSLHDANLFQRSAIAERVTEGTVRFFRNSHLVGDLAYKLSTTLMVGFKNFGNLTEEQRNFNYRLNKCRADIENAFAMLKGRFRRLKYMETNRLDLISMFIVSATILHNACLLNDDLPDFVNIAEEIAEERRNNLNEVNAAINADNNGQQKRLNIMYNLPPN